MGEELPASTEDDDPSPVLATVVRFESWVYAAPAARPRAVGHARRGTVLQVLAESRRQGCSGRWYRLLAGGFVCTSRGVALVDARGDLPTDFNGPASDRPLPYRYGKIVRNKAARFARLPTVAEERDARRGVKRRVVDKFMAGAYFVAVDRPEQTGDGRRFYRTVNGRFVHRDDVELLSESRMHGEFLGPGRKLPLAFVHGGAHPAYVLEGEQRLRQQGQAMKHARFPVRRMLKKGNQTYVVGPHDVAVKRAAVRIVDKTDRPAGVPADTRWVHIDTSRQTLVAYEGDSAVFATIVSGGKLGYEAPSGLYRVRVKRITTTMKGPDRIDGWYEVEEVPWTMYYHRGFAVHGAYWHNDFGQGRSHGCTNLAPADARWLFKWAEPELPEGWHGRVRSGTHLYFTG